MGIDFLTDFPYDIRRGEAGAPMEVPGPEGTLTLHPNGTFGKPEFLIYGCWGLTGECDITWLENPKDFTTNDLEKVAQCAREGLDSLPDLGYKFMTTYWPDKRMFYACYLVTTSLSDWWKKYPLIHTGEPGVRNPVYAIKWSDRGYVRDLRSNSRPYTDKIEEAKVWTTAGRAYRWLGLKDKTWAADCKVVPVTVGESG